jgi:hypothetical protein
MITDSPYKLGELLIKRRFGAVAGIISASLMLLIVSLLSSASGLSVARLLSQVASAVLPRSLEANLGDSALTIGLGVHLMFGVIFGVLHAMCQQSAPFRGLVGVGVFFGFVLWVISGLVIGWVFDPAIRSVLRSWPWLIAHIVYGLCLAGVAIFFKNRADSMRVAAPID